MLPQLRRWLDEFARCRDQFGRKDDEIAFRTSQGEDIGGALSSEWVSLLATMKSVLKELDRSEIQVKDLEKGLVDFPALIDGREVFLCWEKTEEDIGHWHELDAGYAGRKRL